MISVPRSLQRALLPLLLILAGPVSAQGPVDLSTYYDLIYQIKVIEIGTNSKVAIGSGFQISEDGLVVTNYHVVSNYVMNPDSYRIEFLDQHQLEGGLELINFDVVNDLALLRRSDPPAEYLPLAAAELTKGDEIYALGNPRDVGIILVSGKYNGRAELNYTPNILFSGSLNPGMSGGPSLNMAGEVIGVNVATAGSQLSFLIPAERIASLLSRSGEKLSSDLFREELVEQILAYQSERVGDLIEREWPLAPLGRGMAIREIRPDMRCWGSSNERDPDDLYSMIMLGCNSADNVYISDRLDTGQIHYSFAYKSTDQLGAYRFHRYLSDNALNGDNRAGRNEVSDYRCQENYIQPDQYGLEATQNLAIFCVRDYSDLDGLYDVLFFGTVTDGLESLTAHFTLAGVDHDLAQQFTRKFMQHIRWN